ncbi:effector-associated constant component EACC1 [Streptomyces sp. NPDC002643]
MECRITVVTPDRDGGGPSGLFRWLAQDPDVRSSAQLALVPASERAGDMGGAFEIINAVVANSLALSGVAIAAASWRETRAPRPTVRIECAGVVVEVGDDSPETIARITRVLSEAAGAGAQAEPGQGGGTAPDGAGAATPADAGQRADARSDQP